MSSSSASPAAPVVRLRPVVLDDLDFLWHWRHGVPDPEWKRWDGPYFATGPSPSREEFDRAERRRLGSPHRLLVEADGVRAGVVTRSEEDPTGGGWWELGIVLYDPVHWGGGIGREALVRWTRRTFAETGAHVLTLTTWSGNERMIRAGLAAGYVECGRIPGARAWLGRRWDSVKLCHVRP